MGARNRRTFLAAVTLMASTCLVVLLRTNIVGSNPATHLATPSEEDTSFFFLVACAACGVCCGGGACGRVAGGGGGGRWWRWAAVRARGGVNWGRLRLQTPKHNKYSSHKNLDDTAEFSRSILVSIATF